MKGNSGITTHSFVWVTDTPFVMLPGTTIQYWTLPDGRILWWTIADHYDTD